MKNFIMILSMLVLLPFQALADTQSDKDDSCAKGVQWLGEQYYEKLYYCIKMHPIYNPPYKGLGSYLACRASFIDEATAQLKTMPVLAQCPELMNIMNQNFFTFFGNLPKEVFKEIEDEKTNNR